MLDLTKSILPSTVNVNGIEYPVKTGFKTWLCFGALVHNKKSVDPYALDFVYRDKKPVNRRAAVGALFDFYQPKEETPRADGETDAEKLTDFYKDGSYIYAAFMQCYGIDLIDNDIHWHRFLALFTGLKDTFYNDIIGFRAYEETGEKYEDSMKKARARWELPLETTPAMEKLNARFN